MSFSKTLFDIIGNISIKVNDLSVYIQVKSPSPIGSMFTEVSPDYITILFKLSSLVVTTVNEKLEHKSLSEIKKENKGKPTKNLFKKIIFENVCILLILCN